MPITVNVDYETCDQIVEQIILEAYRDLNNDIKNNTWGDEDTEMFKKVIVGLDLVGNWFVHNWDKKKKAKK